MRLLTRLSLSHAAPIAILAMAMVVVLLSLIRMTSLIGEVRDDELGTIQQEESLHDVAWAIEIAARRGVGACTISSTQEVSERVERELYTRGRAAEAALALTPEHREVLGHAVENYAVFAARISAGGGCAQLLAEDTKQELLRLDDALTEAWIRRLHSLHSSMTLKEDVARKLGVRATVEGVALALLACVFAALLSRTIAHTVTVPLGALAQAARRMGEGDFSATVPVKGPVEVVQLGAELEVMRRKLSELESLKQNFLAQISHELRTPLTKLREALALLGDGAAGALSERQTRIVKIARDACEREIRMVSALLDLSRLRAGSPLRMTAGASVESVVGAAIAYEQPEASSHGVHIELRSSDALQEMTLDEAMVERAVANLVRNAVSVSPRGSTVRVECEPAEGPEGQPGVRICVHDSGPGVPEEMREQLFRPFATHPVGDGSHRAGVGLGLALSREAARAHGGDVELLEEDEAHGATFAVWLPIEPTSTAEREDQSTTLAPK